MIAPQGGNAGLDRRWRHRHAVRHEQPRAENPSQGLGRDPHSGEIFCFRGRKADVVKLLWFDGIGVSLYAKRLEAGKFVWPSSATGEAVAISAAQLGYLLDGIDWRNPRWTQKPKKMG